MAAAARTLTPVTQELGGHVTYPKTLTLEPPRRWAGV